MTSVVVTRTAEQVGGLSGRLRALGFEVIEVPVIAIADPLDGGASLRAAVAQLDTYEWVVVSSVNAAARLCAVLARAPVPCRFAAVGPATAAVLADAGYRVELVPRHNLAEGLVLEFPVGSGKVLFPRAAEGRDVIIDGLSEKGWAVDLVAAYRTVSAPPPPAALVARAASADAIAFTSSSTVVEYLRLAGRGAVPEEVFCIGPICAATAADNGLAVAGVANPHTLDGLIHLLKIELLS